MATIGKIRESNGEAKKNKSKKEKLIITTVAGRQASM